MPIYSVNFYNNDPLFILSQTVGGLGTWTGEADPSGTATITDNETGIEGQTLDSNVAGGETATADVAVGGATSTGAAIYAEESWTLTDTVTGEVFNVITLRIDSGGATGYYTLSEIPLVVGRSYETLEFDVDPDVTTGDPAFSIDDYEAPGEQVDGTGGNDTIDATYVDADGDSVNTGDDTVFAGAGDDNIESGNGDDRVFGDIGSDTILGGDGNDFLKGGEQDPGIGGTDIPSDTFTVINLGTFADIDPNELNGESEDAADLLGTYGGVGAELYNNFQTAQTLDTSGDNILSDNDAGATPENIVIDGITYQLDSTQVYTATVTFSDESSGTFTAVVSQTTTGETFLMPEFDPGLDHTLLISQPIVSITLETLDVPNTALVAERIDKNYKTPLPSADTAGDSIEGGAGNDTLIGDQGDDTLLGGTGADSLSGGADNDTLDGGDGSDTLFGGAGDDLLISGGETINDTLNELNGGNGDDTIRIEGPFNANDQITGGAGIDELQLFPDDNRDLTVNMLAGNVADGTIGTQEYTGIENVTTGGGNDTITGDGVDNVLNGGAGTDSITGGGGNDTLIGGTGADELFGGLGDDEIYLAEGDSAFGGSGDDLFVLGDLAEAGASTITLVGGETGETTGDTLLLTPDVSNTDITFTNTDDAAGGLSGNFTMTDGTVVTFSEIENIICFTPGTRILTPRGERRIEDLRAGDKVITRDSGPQTIRWIGHRTVEGRDKFAPIAINSNVMEGARRPLLVSPQHRILFTGYRAQLLFGESEVLVAAKHLVDGSDVRVLEREKVTYFHMMLDRHEVVYAEGAATESFHAGDVGLGALSDQSRDDMFRVFPDLRSNVWSYGPTARPCLKKHEAQLLIEPQVLPLAA